MRYGHESNKNVHASINYMTHHRVLLSNGTFEEIFALPNLLRERYKKRFLQPNFFSHRLALKLFISLRDFIHNLTLMRLC